MAFFGAWLILGIAVYATLIRYLLPAGGRVPVAEFGPPDLGVVCGLLSWFGISVVRGFGGPEHPVTVSGIITVGVLFSCLVLFIAGFMKFRGIDPLRQFGITRPDTPGLLACAGMGIGLVLAAFPLVMFAGNLTTRLMHGRTQPQDIVQYFIDASQKSDRRAIYLTMIFGVVVAPAAEETIFRGYIYPVLKRYIGGVPGALLSAGLFAAVHLTPSALPALLLLALCLTLAYEATGSLLVNIFMHALFNLGNFLLILAVSRHLIST